MNYYRAAVRYLERERGATEDQIYEAIDEHGLVRALIELEQATAVDRESRNLRSEIREVADAASQPVGGLVDASLAVAILVALANEHDDRNDIAKLAEWFIALSVHDARDE